MLQNITVRKIIAEDWELYKEMRLQALKSLPIAFWSSYEEAEKFSDEEWIKRATPSTAITYWIFVDNEIAWMAWWKFSKKQKVAHVATIRWVFVKEQYRWKWYALKLLESTLEDIESYWSYKKVSLMVNAEQIAAIKFYKKLWFVEVGRLKNELFYDDVYYDELVMEYYL